MSREIGETLVKLLGKAIDGPAALSRAAAVATLTVVEYLVGCVDCGMASDIHDIKECLVRKARAETDAAAADAQKRLAEATEAANRAALHKRNDAIARAERARLQAEADKTQAEADATRSDAQTRRLQAETEAQARLTEAKSRFIEAVAKLRLEGGDIFFDREALQKTLNAGPPPEEEPKKPGPQK